MSETADEKPCYYVPCLIKIESRCDIYETFNVTDCTCKKSAWLCFKFRFKPPHIMNHLIASLSRKYEIAEVVVPNQKKKSVALFGGIAVFELQKKTHLRKLLVMTFPNFIQVQVLEFGKNSIIKRGLYKDIGDFVTDELKKIIHTRFKMSTVEFEKKIECGHTKPELVTGSNELSEEQITEYLCGTCKTPHTFDGEWSEIESKALSDKYEKKPGQRGLVLIVNFMFHGVTTERKGSDVDCKNLTNFFEEELKYQVECTTRDMTKLELQDYFQEIARKYLTVNSKDYHSFICVIMSHGNKDGILTTNGYITVEEIKKPFKNKTGGKFNGKPKVFLIQACRGKEEQEKVVVSDCFETEIHTGHVEGYDEFPGNRQRRSSVEMSVFQPGVVGKPSGLSEVFSTDAHSYYSEHVPTDADIIVAYATTPGYISIRNIYEGAFFIRAFLSVAKNKYNEEHIEEILRNVRRELATNPEYAPQSGSLAGKCQMGMLETTSTKKFFL
ncbi:CASP3 [Mytilus edulis]|uniref:CASP3 n=1 Tax=Mytilus edulis TaxID=6550 RepID=A0A8S3TFB9_MYTED|nr:CASP3 [Mytilus edulis]